METVQKRPVSNLSMEKSYLSMEKSYGMCKVDSVVADEFPAGLRVLVVDDDMACLKILEQMLVKCLYRVTTCSRATNALSILREKKGSFDVVISDVHMPDMDGFKLLEHVGLEMDLPVIMMSADGRTSAVMMGIRHGACDYLIKPVRIEELKNIWQHVIRKKWNENKELEHSGTDDTWKAQKKRRDTKGDEDEDELESDDPSTSKKPRVVWSVELHQQFVSAVNQLGIDKAVPKRILELMNVPGLTRENVASHLQKFRLYLKRLSGIAQHQGGSSSSFYGPAEPNGSLGRLDIHALAASGQIPPQTLAALHAELLGRPTGSLVLPQMDQPIFLQASLQGSKCIPVDRGVIFGRPLIKCQSNVSKQFPQPTISVEDISSGLATWPPNHLGAVVPAGNNGGLDTQNGTMLMHALQQQQQQQPSVLPGSTYAINVQPSCLVVPSLSSNGFQSGRNTAPINQNSFIGSKAADNYSTVSSQSNNISLGGGQALDRDFKNVGVLNGYPIQDVSISPLVSSSSVSAESCTDWQVQNSSMNVDPATRLLGVKPTVFETSGSHGTKIGMLPNQVKGRNHGFVGKGISIPSRFAVDDDVELAAADDLSYVKVGTESGDRAKQELRMEFMEGAKLGIPVLHCSQSDFMSILSK
ncbi:hypothetical protein MRB53_001477 [Persea americana]|uniref:Uncharacterized protein n=1 Tax=Persea americana TaxID=3435 RepID=A0ACC2MRY6_PERAE|nr:hypothetical protein MRB53_001477 [Persea americana]